MAGLFWNVQAAKRKAREREELANALRQSYEPGPEIPYVDEAGEAMGVGTPEGLSAGNEPGRVNIENALAQMYQGPGDQPVRALELQQALQRQQGNQPNATKMYNDWKRIGETEGREAQMVYEDMIRQNYQMQNVNGVPTMVRVGMRPQKQPLGTLEGEAGAKEKLAGAQRRGAKIGEAKAEAELDLPKVESEANYTVGLLDQLLEHPGLTTAVGKSRFTGAHKIPGTEAYDFEVLRKQIGGKQFMTAYQDLKGGGQITEIEGEQARDALARMDAAQSEEAFMKGARDFQSVIKRGLERARKLAGVTASPGEGPTVGVVEDGHIFQGGDPADPKNWKPVR